MRRILTALCLSVAVLNLSGCMLELGGSDNDASWHDGQSDGDSSLARAVRARLDGDPVTQVAEFTVSSEHGRIYLDGVTANPEVLAKAVQIILDTPDVKSVRCHVSIIK